MAALHRNGSFPGTSRSRSFGTSALLLAGATAAFAAGCEKGNDASVQLAVTQGSNLLQSAEPEKSATELTKVTTTEHAAGALLAAKNTLGHAKLSSAQQKMIALDALYMNIGRLQSEISQYATAIAIGNTLVEGYRQQDPSAARERIKQRIAEAQGGPDKLVWVDTGKLPIPTLTAAKQRVSELQTQAAGHQEKIKKLEADRAALLQNADQLRAAVDTLKGREAVDAYAKASEARKGGSLVSSEIDTVSAQLTTVLEDLKVAEGQLAVVQKYIESLQAQDAAIASGYEGVAKQIAAQVEVSKAAATADAAENRTSLTVKAKQLAELYTQAETLEKEAAGLYGESAAAYASAVQEAMSYRKDLDDRITSFTDKAGPEAKLLGSVKNARWPGTYRIYQGNALSGLGDLYARRAAALSSRESIAAVVAPVLKTAGIQTPESLTADPAAAKAARDMASDAYSKAVVELDSAAESMQGADPEKRGLSARLARIFTLYAWAQMDTLAGDTAGAATQLKLATESRDALVRDLEDAKLPVNLPGSLAIAPTTAPAATPAP